MEIITFDTTRELYRFLKDSGALEKLDLFKKTPQKLIPADNQGYVVLGDGPELEVLGAASLYEEAPGVWFNELFEVTQDHRGQGIGRTLYEYAKEDLGASRIHGFCTTPENKAFWEHLGQVCIDHKTGEMLEVVKKKT